MLISLRSKQKFHAARKLKNVNFRSKELKMLISYKRLTARLLVSLTIMDKSVDTLEQNKRFLSASFRNFEKHLFC